MKSFRSLLSMFIPILLMGCNESISEKKTILSTEFLQHTNWKGTLESIEVTFDIDVQFTTDRRGSLFIRDEKNLTILAFNFFVDNERILKITSETPMILNGIWLIEEINDDYLYLSQNHFGHSKGRLLKIRKI